MLPRFGATVQLALRGHFHLLEAPLEDRAIDCALAVDFHGVGGAFLGRVGRVTGELSAEGVATARALAGSLALRGGAHARLLLTFGFEGDDGAPRTLRGYVEVLPAAPLATVTEVPFSLYAVRAGDDDEVGRGVLRFDARGELGAVLRSLRLRLGAA
ncbi:MAG TPA: hypothetical protein PLR99_23440 [Polyangiaceae bacterium]|nr:hypothetical protein [Polyangiaceae bacterium]